MFLKEVWCEGDIRLNFEACHLGYGRGETLEEVCADLSTRDNYFAKHYSQARTAYKGCKVYLSEAEARVLNG